MEYIAVHFDVHFAEGFMNDIFVDTLASIGFESFEDQLIAYIPENIFSQDALNRVISDFPYPGVKATCIEHIVDHDWNEEWEKNYFKPIVIGDKCVIHSSFHHDYPHLKYDITIDPRMAFGTGHHATTSLIINTLLEIDLHGKAVLDMGCGTAVLAILSSMRGAETVTAIDVDPGCVNNAKDNVALNRIDNIDVMLGDASSLAGGHFDVILANINRNILLMDIPAYMDCLASGGILLMSGFYTEDVQQLEHKLHEHHGIVKEIREHDNWAMIFAVKK
ncbi:MAG TPA: 50S ribosomal protein L11 methyltransferase [Bacteroidales bacterium]|nr:50S ribosomal protein L11 methyltransferase [Bacteroidales bacterium]